MCKRNSAVKKALMVLVTLWALPANNSLGRSLHYSTNLEIVRMWQG